MIFEGHTGEETVIGVVGEITNYRQRDKLRKQVNEMPCSSLEAALEDGWMDVNIKEMSISKQAGPRAIVVLAKETRNIGVPKKEPKNPDPSAFQIFLRKLIS